MGGLTVGAIFEMMRPNSSSSLTALVRIPANLDRFITMPTSLVLVFALPEGMRALLQVMDFVVVLPRSFLNGS